MSAQNSRRNFAWRFRRRFGRALVEVDILWMNKAFWDLKIVLESPRPYYQRDHLQTSHQKTLSCIAGKLQIKAVLREHLTSKQSYGCYRSSLSLFIELTRAIHSLEELTCCFMLLNVDSLQEPHGQCIFVY